MEVLLGFSSNPTRRFDPPRRSPDEVFAFFNSPIAQGNHGEVVPQIDHALQAAQRAGKGPNPRDVEVSPPYCTTLAISANRTRTSRSMGSGSPITTTSVPITSAAWDFLGPVSTLSRVTSTPSAI
ncbi:MAG: hypothetical protein CM1200mP3_11240 [Chloroflexota bacterium]|nr:MAG: hypothetical protein CM1200mP3_11240 [Chloroflexota bacterium]